MEEYGQAPNVRFPDPDSVRAYDANGNVILCKCGQPAGISMVSKNYCRNWCKDCYPKPKLECIADFLYVRHDGKGICPPSP